MSIDQSIQEDLKRETKKKFKNARILSSLNFQVVFYIIAGLNHFINPTFYLDLIPSYFMYPVFINNLSGGMEILLGIGLFFHPTRKLAAYSIILMLAAFIPSHVYFIQIGSCVEDGLCVPQWVGWFRLIIIHPILMYWAWVHRK